MKGSKTARVRSVTLVAGGVLALGAPATLPGCGGSGGAERTDARSLATPNRPLWQEPKSPSTADEVAPEPTSPTAALRVDDGRDTLAAHAMDLQALFDQMKTQPQEDPPALAGQQPDPPAPSSPAPPPRPAPLPEPSATVQPLEPPPAPASEPAALAAPSPPPLTPEERRAELLAQLASILGRAGGGPDATIPASGPLARAVRLAALEAIEPGIATQELNRLESELLPTEAAVLRPLRELFGRLGSSATGQGDPAAIAALLDEYAQRLAQAKPLKLPTALLCERVESFGRYTPFRAATFAAGREHSAILYVEVENFTQRAAPGAGSEQFITELAQSLDLHHDADGSLQWRQAEQAIRETSRRRRSDYYLVQRVTLPSTLSVGRYNLKVTVTDRVSGATAQARIPIQIVADPSLAKTP